MASILDKYGIKEVADVTFYDIDETSGKPTKPVLYLDTLKVSTIEQTAETTEARGGKGNAALISWDYGKEINVTLEDALFSAKSMAIMFGNGTVKPHNTTATTSTAATSATDNAYIMRTEEFVATSDGTPTAAGWQSQYEGPNGKTYQKLNPKFYTADGIALSTALSGDKTIYADPSGVTLSSNERYFCTYDLYVNGGVIEISANSFPGTYYVTGDTYARSSISGKDEFFQFIIPKAKMNAENTITLEAEGDPSVFNMSLKVLRPTDGIMMKLVKYDLTIPAGNAAEATSNIIHNHELTPSNTPET